MSSFMACRTPKLIVHGVEDFSRLDEIVRFGKNYQIKNFDIVKMENEGIITLIFAVHQEAVDFGQYLEQEKGYRVELTLVRELQEIPETDENFYQQRELI